ALDDGPELVAELRREVLARRGDEIGEPPRERVAAGTELGLRKRSRRARESRPAPVLGAAEDDEVRLEPVVVALARDRLAALDLGDELRDLEERLREVVVRIPFPCARAER